MRRKLILCMLGLMPVLCASASGITVSGTWSETIGSDDLFAGTGTDIRSPIVSGAAQAVLDIADTGGRSWTVYLRRAEIAWHADVTLSVRRSGDGSGSGSIVGGTDYRPVTASDQVFFTGSGDRAGIGIELRLEGVSVAQDPNLYETAVTYSVR
ncbi:MAG: hypothetical protein K9L70_06445 [Thiohalocapsa sp.]|nr:hypothetical protein [Thiohalocapsa sp.]MCF7989879.1 hypothetical protein [Thiohalocapsa sp.]